MKYALPIAPKKEKTKTFIFTEESLAEHDRKVRADQIPDAICVCNAMYSAAVLLSIRDELGFGKERMARLFNRIQRVFKAITTKHINYYDIIQQLREECDVNLVIERPDGSHVDMDDLYKSLSGYTPWRIYYK